MLLASISGVECTENVPLSTLTRFSIGGPARILADASTEVALIAAASIHASTHALTHASTSDEFALIGGGSNLVADDAGFPGVVLRYTANRIEIEGPLVR